MFVLSGCGKDEKEMLFHAGIGQRSSLLDIKKLFEEIHPDARINFSFKGSGFFLADAERSHKGDLYMPGEEFYLLQALERGLIESYDPIKDSPAYFMTVIITPVGNPANIQGIKDFARPGVKISLANPKAAAVGVWHERTFKKAGIWEEVQANQIQSAKCIAEVLAGVQNRIVDGTITWSSNAVLALRDVEIVPIEPEYRGLVRLPVSITSFSQHPDLARELIDLMVSDEGRRIFESHAYVTDPGAIDDKGFCADGGAATDKYMKWLINAARLAKNVDEPLDESLVGPLVIEVERQRLTRRAGTMRGE